MKDAIATLEVAGIKPNGEHITIIATIGQPCSIQHASEWTCPISVTPLYSTLRDIRGADAFQALYLAHKLIIDLLYDFKDKGGTLLYKNGETFPLEAYGYPPKWDDSEHPHPAKAKNNAQN